MFRVLIVLAALAIPSALNAQCANGRCAMPQGPVASVAVNTVQKTSTVVRRTVAAPVRFLQWRRQVRLERRARWRSWRCGC